MVRNTDNVVDSRDVIARIEELGELAGPDPEELDELSALRRLAKKCDWCPDWESGATLIRDSYFKDHALNATTWPTCCINWDRAVEELQMGYFEVCFDGVLYWIRG